MIVRVVVPRRTDGGHRDRLWSYCRARWERDLPGWEIVEGHHDTGPFNRSAAINQAATGPWDVAVVVDADVVLDPAPVEQAAEMAAETGRLVLPFTHRRSLSAAGTTTIVNGRDRGSWRPWVTETQDWNVSTCVVVSRQLWDQVGGFDERFVGWGGEDEAFHAACLAIAGTVRLPGDAWHLHHPAAPWKDHRSADYRQTLGLADRYVTTACPGADRRRPGLMVCPDPEPMRRLLAEDRGADQVVVVCITNGARDTLAKTVHSADEMLRGPIGRRVICDGSKGKHGAIAAAHPGWDVVDIGQDPGYGLAMRRAYETAIASGQPWVLWLEDDFTFPEPVDLAEMQAVMAAHPDLVQLALKRQPWYDNEIAAGGIIEAHPDRYTQRDGHVAHRAFWTSNPMLCRRSFLARFEWPHARWSEGRFGRQVFRSDPEAKSAFLGLADDPPRCTHIGVERAGRGY